MEMMGGEAMASGVSGGISIGEGVGTVSYGKLWGKVQ